MKLIDLYRKYSCPFVTASSVLIVIAEAGVKL